MHTSYSDIAKRHLSKNKKYFLQRVQDKDKENIVEGDIDSIVEKLSYQKSMFSTHLSVFSQIKKSSYLGLKMQKELKTFSDFTEANKVYVKDRKKIRKQITACLNKMNQQEKLKLNMFQEYLSLAQETIDYLQYYLTTFVGRDQETAAQILNEKGKVIILLLLKKKFKSLGQNSSDILQRVLLSFNLNPLNDFQLISWEKFMKIRKLMNGDFNRKQSTQFIIDYFFISEEKTLTGRQFWGNFISVIRKVNKVMNDSSFSCLIEDILNIGKQMLNDDKIITKTDLRKIINNDPLFIWKEFVILIFI